MTLILAALSLIMGVRIGHALIEDGFTTYNQPAASVAMPFDNSEFSRTIVQVANVGVEPVSTHWSVWNESGAPLGDVFVCLTSPDSFLTFADDLVSLDAENHTVGESLDLTGRRGSIVITAYRTDDRCAPAEETGLPVKDQSITATYRIENFITQREFVSRAPGFGLNASGTRVELPDFELRSFFVGSQNPQTLLDSDVVLFAVQEGRGLGRFAQVELGPPANPIAGEASFPTGRPEDQVQDAAPFSFLGALFESAIPGDLLPPTLAPTGGGIVRFARFQSPVGRGVFVFGRHGETAAFGTTAFARSSQVTIRQGIEGGASTLSTAGYEQSEEAARRASPKSHLEVSEPTPLISKRRRSALRVDEGALRTFVQ